MSPSWLPACQAAYAPQLVTVLAGLGRFPAANVREQPAVRAGDPRHRLVRRQRSLRGRVLFGRARGGHHGMARLTRPGPPEPGLDWPARKMWCHARPEMEDLLRERRLPTVLAEVTVLILVGDGPES